MKKEKNFSEFITVPILSSLTFLIDSRVEIIQTMMGRKLTPSDLRGMEEEQEDGRAIESEFSFLAFHSYGPTMDRHCRNTHMT